MRIGGLGPWELMIIVGLVLLVFGPKRLPDLGKNLAEGIKNFKRGMKSVQEVESVVKKELKDI
ncbi:MAG: twin-arginine translocase TatA/TatE family subunit [Deltaproteobacteria bacterium]|nr:MAG: twin-arginine translocase TatA/TatE family subunit [Deltaproteobacteria bacterium]